VDCQSYVAFVIEVVGTLGLCIGPNITWNEITIESTDEPIKADVRQRFRFSGFTP
jgi:hypothetical protein